MRNSRSTPRTLILLPRSQLTCSSAMQMTHKGEGKAPKMCVIMQEEGEEAETGEEQSQQSQQQLPSRMPRNAQAARERERAAERSVSVRSHLSRAAAHTLSLCLCYHCGTAVRADKKEKQCSVGSSSNHHEQLQQAMKRTMRCIMRNLCTI